jgi:bifunctional non-homologous end joining protein LigD
VGLSAYQHKRHFARTSEPRGHAVTTHTHRFVVHEHHASHLHYDFRLEMGGVLKSWAVPKGPSLDPRQKRLAVMVEDHPVEYLTFSGHIEEGNYGAGEVIIWDTGRYKLSGPGDLVQQLKDGKISVVLYGKKLHGVFHLVRLKARAKQWLLIKGTDEFAETTHKNAAPARAEPEARPLPSSETNHSQRRSRKVAEKSLISHATADEEVDSLSSGGEQSPPLAGARRAAMPHTLTPMLATLVDHPFSQAEWVYETKWDGVRTLCFLNPQGLRLVSRTDKDITLRYPELAALPQAVAVTSAILDGEIVAFDEQERSNFQLLQGRVGLKNPSAIARLAHKHPAVYCVFDLLYCNGWDVRSAALSHRKQLLRQLLRPGPAVRYSEHTVGDGIERYAAARRAVAEYPQLGTLERSRKRRRGGRIYLDHLQNARGKSVVAPYSVRAEAGAPVSTPLTWAEVEHALSPCDFTMATLPHRLKQRGDLFAPVLTQKQELGEASERLQALCRQELGATSRKRTRRTRTTKRRTL